MTENELKTIIENHQLWLEDNSKGECANLHYAMISHANLSDVNLSHANLSGVILHSSNLSNANLSNANLRGANLHSANLSNANLHNSDLSRAIISHADLRNANLSGVDLKKIKAWNTVGNGKEIKTTKTEKYTINIINSKIVQIGCEYHSFNDWMKFDDETIDQMDAGALEWWKKWKSILKILVDKSK